MKDYLRYDIQITSVDAQDRQFGFAMWLLFGVIESYFLWSLMHWNLSNWHNWFYWLAIKGSGDLAAYGYRDWTKGSKR